MRLRRKSQLVYFPITGDGDFDMPDNAVIVSVNHIHEQPLGVWAELVTKRYDEDSASEVPS